VSREGVRSRRPAREVEHPETELERGVGSLWKYIADDEVLGARNAIDVEGEAIRADRARVKLLVERPTLKL
jgi:hypothetical protein